MPLTPPKFLRCSSWLFFLAQVVEYESDCLYSPEMDIKTLRWQKTRRLVSEAGGISRFADRIERSQQQANRFAGPNPVTGIGNKIARLIETAFGRKYGYLDKPEGSDSNLSEPADSPIDAIRKANQAAAEFVEARGHWLRTRPQCVYMVRSDLRGRLLDAGVEIVSESDDSFSVLQHGKQMRVDLFIPLSGFNVYRYESSYSMTMPDVLVIPVCTSSTNLSFYLIPGSILCTLPNSDALTLNDAGGTLNGVSIADCLNDLSSLI